MLPRRGKKIDGVDSSSMLGLQAAIFKSEQRRNAAAPAAPRAASSQGKKDVFSRVNRGVTERDDRVLREEATTSTVKADALLRKSAHYARIARGDEGAPGHNGGGDGLIDWDRKRWEEATLLSSDMKRDISRRRWEEEARSHMMSSTPGFPVMHSSHFIHEVSAETAAGRERTVALKSKRNDERAAREEAILAKRARSETQRQQS